MIDAQQQLKDPTLFRELEPDEYPNRGDIGLSGSGAMNLVTGPDCSVNMMRTAWRSNDRNLKFFRIVLYPRTNPV